MNSQPDAETRTLLKKATALAMDGYWDELEAMLRHTPLLAVAVDDCGESLLHTVARLDGGERTIGLLLEMGADPNQVDDSGATPLGNAISSGHRHGIDTDGNVARLIAAGADLTLADDTGKPPLHKAIYERRPSVLALLLAAGADPRTPDSAGDDAYAYAIRIGAESMLSYLPQRDPVVRQR